MRKLGLCARNGGGPMKQPPPMREMRPAAEAKEKGLDVEFLPESCYWPVNTLAVIRMPLARPQGGA